MLYAKTLAGKIKPDLKANLNEHPAQKVIFSWKITKAFQLQICFHIYYLQKFSLNEKLNLYYHI